VVCAGYCTDSISNVTKYIIFKGSFDLKGIHHLIVSSLGELIFGIGINTPEEQL